MCQKVRQWEVAELLLVVARTMLTCLPTNPYSSAFSVLIQLGWLWPFLATIHCSGHATPTQGNWEVGLGAADVEGPWIEEWDSVLSLPAHARKDLRGHVEQECGAGMHLASEAS